MKGKLGRYKTKRSLYQDKDVARRPGEVWHGDLCGPEAATGCIKVYPIKRKSDTLNCLKKLRKDLRSLRVHTRADTKIYPLLQPSRQQPIRLQQMVRQEKHHPEIYERALILAKWQG